MVIVLVAATVVVIALSQFLHWQIIREQGLLNQLQTVRTAKGSDNMALLAERAKLTSKTHVAAVAGARLGLYLPADGQVHRL
jgi:cell division protein FtsL